METAIKNLKADLYHVFVEGNAKNQEFAHVFMLLDIPLLCVVLALCFFA
jgi:hypothetical protein